MQLRTVYGNYFLRRKYIYCGFTEIKLKRAPIRFGNFRPQFMCESKLAYENFYNNKK